MMNTSRLETILEQDYLIFYDESALTDDEAPKKGTSYTFEELYEQFFVLQGKCWEDRSQRDLCWEFIEKCIIAAYRQGEIDGADIY